MTRIFFEWTAKEYEKKEKSKRFYLVSTLLLAIVIFYALLTNNPIVAVTFILIGVVGFLIIEKDPKPINFAITEDGVLVGNELYAYENIHSFWIFYEVDGPQQLSLHTQSDLTPYIRIPLGDNDPNRIRLTLLDFLPEKKHELSLIDRLSDLF